MTTLGFIILQSGQHAVYNVETDFNYYLELKQGSTVTFRSKYGRIININKNIWGSGVPIFECKYNLNAPPIGIAPCFNMMGVNEQRIIYDTDIVSIWEEDIPSPIPNKAEINNNQHMNGIISIKPITQKYRNTINEVIEWPFDNKEDVELFKNANCDDLIKSQQFIINGCTFSLELPPNGYQQESAKGTSMIWCTLNKLPHNVAAIKVHFKCKCENISFYGERIYILTTSMLSWLDTHSYSMSIYPAMKFNDFKNLNSFSFLCYIKIIEFYDKNGKPIILSQNEHNNQINKPFINNEDEKENDQNSIMDKIPNDLEIKQKLEQLQSMGFDETISCVALIESHYNINAAIQLITDQALQENKSNEPGPVAIQEDKFKPLLIHYDNKIMKHRLAENIDVSNNEIYINLLCDIKTYFNIKQNIEIIDDEKCNIDDMDDIEDVYVTYQDEPNFVLNLHVKLKEMENVEIVINTTNKNEISNRLIAVMMQYNECMNKDGSNINQFIEQQVNIQTVLNDFLYLLNNMNDDEQFESIYNTFGYCNLENCKIFDNKQHYGEKAHVYHILNKIHCHYQHCYDIGNRLSMQEKRKCIIERKEDEEIKDNENNTFVNDAIIKMSEILQNKRKSYENIKQLKSRNSKYNRLGSQTENKNIEGNVENDMNNMNNMNDGMYSFGVKFKYDNNDDGDITITPKYTDGMKAELTQNKIARINIEQFQNEYKKAQFHFNSTYRKQYYSQMSIWHVLSLMIYCNYDELQYKFSKTYRININEHENFYFLGKYLKFSIHECGTAIREKNDKGELVKLYHGVGKQLTFPQVIGCKGNGVIINCPLSTSCQLSTAVNFTNHNKGLIIHFGYDDKAQSVLSVLNRLKYFAVSWLSDYSNESECLFIQNPSPLNITNIQDAKHGFDYDMILKSLNYIEKITSKENIANISESFQILITAIVHNQLSYKFSKYASFDSLSSYGKELINIYCKQNKTKFEIDYQGIQKYKCLWNLLCESNENGLQIDKLTVLFPNCREIKIHNISNNSFCASTIENFQKIYDSHSKLNKLYFQKESFRNGTISIKDIKSYQKIGFDIFIKDNWLKIQKPLEFKFNKYEKNHFEIREDETLATGLQHHICAYSIVTTKTKFNRGIHKWTIQFIKKGHHHTNPGVITDITNLSKIGRSWESLISYKGSAVTGYCFMWHDNTGQLEGYHNGEQIVTQGNNTQIKQNDIITIILNCNNWTLTFIRNNNQKIGQLNNLPQNQSYYPMLYSCDCTSQQYKLISAESVI